VFQQTITIALTDSFHACQRVCVWDGIGLSWDGRQLFIGLLWVLRSSAELLAC